MWIASFSFNHKRYDVRRAITACFSSVEYRWYVGATLAMSTFTGVTFSSMTCLRVARASTSASASVMSRRYPSSRADCAPSLPDPIARASCFTNMPDGSVWNRTGPVSSSWPAMSSATPNGRLMPPPPPSSSSSPKRRARSHTDCVHDSTGIGSLNWNRCCWVSLRAWSISVRASAVRPLMAQPMCSSISATFSLLFGTSKGDVMRFSTASTTPSDVFTPMAVEPSLIASIAYSTWNSRPSGLNVFTPRSYSDRVKNMMANGMTLLLETVGFLFNL
mmetsp:Transcript_17044/g.50876  ORF Transcript_17044/g.50876 Transcript_17044/m.50876 type:complete len:276 (-) Transcript_17044:174-1001(-)